MSGHNLTQDGEFRYIVQWFHEWSELQRDDFLPILVEYLTKDGPGHYMNGVVNSLASASCADKPMSLFQCRVKLFREWNTKWPEDFKLKLKEKVTELDPPYGERLKEEILHAFAPENGNGIVAINGEPPSPVVGEEPIATAN